MPNRILVRDADVKPGSIIDVGSRQPNASSRVRVFGSIVQEVRQHLFHARGIGLNDKGSIR
jgi:hypothetical protein